MSRSRWGVPLIIVLLGFPLVGYSADFSGTVIGILDGDTIDVLHNGQAERIRLNGIDCPEKGQPYGKRAKRFLSDLLASKTVTIHSYKLDRHKRTIADVFLADGTNVNRELVRAGLAWWYRQYSKDESLGSLEAEAREAKRGLWIEPNPIPPWVYRHPELAKEESLSQENHTNLPNLSTQIEGPIIGNKNSRVYHRPDCPSYTATLPKNRAIFNSVKNAEKAGYRVAGNCP